MAFEHVTSTARRDRLLAMRAAFLAKPTRYRDGDFDWRSRMYNDALVYVSATAPGGGNGSVGAPYKLSEWNVAEAQVSRRRVVFTGDFRNLGVVPRKDHLTLDLRAATVSRAMKIAFSNITAVGGTSWTKADGTSATLPANCYKVTAINPSDGVSVQFSVADAFMQLCVAGLTYMALSRTHSANAGSVRIYSVDVATGYLQVRTPWQLNVGERLALLPGTLWTTPLGDAALNTGTTYWVVAATGWGDQPAGGNNTNSGYQKIKLSTTRGGSPIAWTTADAAAMAPQGSTYLGLYTLHELTTGAQVPNPGTLAAGYFAYCPWESAIYFRTSTTLLSSHEVLVTSNQGAGVSINQLNDVHVLGGDILVSHRGVLLDTGSQDCGVWGGRVIGSLRGICLQTSPVGTKTRYCEVSRAKYALASEEAASGEARTSHAYFYCHDLATDVHNWADRQPLMVNPQSGFAEFRDGLIEDHGVASFGSVTLPANQYAPLVSTWGSAANDSSSDLVMRNIYFSRCYGPNAFMNSTSLPIARLKVERCVFDMRSASAGSAKSPASVWALATGTASIDSMEINDNLFLLGDISQQAVFDGSVRAAGVLMASSNGGRPVNVKARGNIVVGGSGTDSTLFMLQNLTENDLSARPAVDSDYNTFYCPSVANLFVGVTADSGYPSWQNFNGTLGYKRASVAMPTTPGASTTWTSGGFTNEAHSTVLSAGDMATLGTSLFSPTGDRLISGDLVPPGWAVSCKWLRAA